MLRAFAVRNGLLFLLVSSAVLAQPSATAPAGPATVPVVPTGTAPPLQACATKAFDDYASAMSVWERQWAEGVISVRPDFTTAAIARANAHNSALQRDGFRIHYLAANAPDSLDLDDSIASMRLFDWTPEQEQALRQTQADYSGVADSAERDRLAADAQPKAEELETYFEESFTEASGAAYARKLGEVLQKGNGVLEQCHSKFPAPPKQDAPPIEIDPPAGASPAPAAKPAGAPGGGLALRRV